MAGLKLHDNEADSIYPSWDSDSALIRIRGWVWIGSSTVNFCAFQRRASGQMGPGQKLECVFTHTDMGTLSDSILVVSEKVNSLFCLCIVCDCLQTNHPILTMGSPANGQCLTYETPIIILCLLL